MGARISINESSREDMLAGFGDSEVTMDTYLEAEEAEGSDIKDAGEPPVVATPVPEPTEPEEQAKPQFDPDEYSATIAAQNQLYFSEMQKRIDQQFAQLRPQQPEPQGYEDPVMKLHKEVEELRERERQREEKDRIREERDFRKSYDEAVVELRSKYTDLDEFVPASQRDGALRQALAGKHFDVNWKDAITQVYKLNAFDKYQTGAAKQTDDLAQKREQKRQSGIQAASVVSPGGNPHQAPVERFDPRSASYDRDRRSAFQRGLGAG